MMMMNIMGRTFLDRASRVFWSPSSFPDPSLSRRAYAQTVFPSLAYWRDLAPLSFFITTTRMVMEVVLKKGKKLCIKSSHSFFKFIIIQIHKHLVWCLGFINGVKSGLLWSLCYLWRFSSGGKNGLASLLWWPLHQSGSRPFHWGFAGDCVILFPKWLRCPHNTLCCTLCVSVVWDKTWATQYIEQMHFV